MSSSSGDRPRPPVVVDFDSHVVEPWEMWSAYVEDRFRPVAPRMVADSFGSPRLLVESRLYPTPEGPGRAPRKVMSPEDAERYREDLRSGWDPKHRLAWMDQEGIDACLLMPSQGLAVSSVRDPALATALCRAYNRWLAEYCSEAPERLLAAALVPLQDPTAATAEVKAATELGHRAVFVRPNPVGGRLLADRAYDRLYATVSSLNLPVVVHEGCGFAPGATAAIDRFENGLFSHMVSHPFEQMLATLTLVAGGVLERFPSLQVAFLEAGCGWVPFWLDRMDAHAHQMAWEVPWLKMAPSQYFSRQCFVSTEADDRDLGYVVARLGPEKVVFSTDYPHSDRSPDGSVAALRGRPDVIDEGKDLILGGTAVNLLGLA